MNSAHVTTNNLETVAKSATGMRVSFVACLLLLTGWLVSRTLTQQSNELILSLEETARAPFDYSAHVELSRLYLDMMRLESARTELDLTKTATPDVLGESDTNRLDQELTSLPRETAAALRYWKEIANSYPEYSAGLVQQIFYYYNSGDFESSRQHANTLKFLDSRSFDKLPQELKD